MTGTTWVEESGFLEGPVVLTNTSSVGVARDAVIEWRYTNRLFEPYPFAPDLFYALPVVAETFDGALNDINGFHVRKEHVFDALNSASSGPVAEGNVGGGTGMICFAFKGGIGTASRLVEVSDRTYAVGVLVQANFGSRSELTIAGVPVGEEIRDLRPSFLPTPEGAGSIIAVVATDAPLLPHQLDRIAQRVSMGAARVGSFGSNGSGDIFLAFSTANPGAADRYRPQTVQTLPNDAIDPLFIGTVEATEEAIINALVAAETMIGINGNTVYALPHDRLVEVLGRYGHL
jgi:L-aminopeptidase/D-esterase-like protein